MSVFHVTALHMKFVSDHDFHSDPPECIPTCQNSAYGEVQRMVKNEAYAALPDTQHIYETINNMTAANIIH